MGSSLLKDLKLLVTFKPSRLSESIKAFFPGTPTDEQGNVVIEQSLSGAGGASVPTIEKVQLESPTLTAILIGAAVVVVGVFLWLVLRR